MRKFSKICQIAIAINCDIKDRIEKKIKSSKLVNELLKFEILKTNKI